MAGEDLIELKFRLGDGTDIGPSKYSPSTTVVFLKRKILAQWPKENVPKSINDMKLINAGKLLENKTLAESRLPIGETSRRDHHYAHCRASSFFRQKQ